MPDKTIQSSIPTALPPAENEPFTINEIIGQSPGWILHSGMTVLFLVVVIGVAMTFVLRYPDKIQAFGVITTVDPFKTIVTRTSGVADTVFVGHNELVQDNDPILYIENTADRVDVTLCMAQVDEFERSLNQSGSSIPGNILSLLYSWKDEFTLGPLQSTFASLTQQTREFRHFLRRDDYALKLDAISREIKEIQELNNVLEQEKALTEEEVVLSEKDVNRNRQLFDKGVISAREMERSQATHIGMKKSYLLKGNSMAQNRIRIAGLNQQKTDIQAARQEQTLLYRSRISEIILNLRNQYRQWKQQYYLEAPSSGRLQLSSGLTPGQTLPAGQSIGYVIPDETTGSEDNGVYNPKYGKVYVPSTGMGKLSPGNRSIIRLEAYPYKEYGTIDSRVAEIYPIPERQESGGRIYEIHLPLDSILITDYGYPIHYTPDMPIQVSIIAEERSLFNRIFGQLYILINQHTSLQIQDSSASYRYSPGPKNVN